MTYTAQFLQRARRPPRNSNSFFQTISDLGRAASSSQSDDAMIRARGKRMTVAQLKQEMDRRFDTVDKRFDTVDKRFGTFDKRFDAVTDKLDAIIARLDRKYEHHDQVLDEHDSRLKDLERANRRQ